MKRFKKLLPIAVTLALLAVLAMPMTALAAALTVTDTLSTYVKSTAANHTIGYTTVAETAVSGTITITFPADFTMGSVAFGDIDLSVATVDKLLAASPGTGTGTAIGVGVAGQVITFTLNDTDVIAAAAAIEIKIGTNATSGTNQITNPATAAEYTITVTSASGTDSGSVTVDITATGTTGASGDVVPTIEITTQPPAIAFGNMAIGTVYTSTESNNGLVKSNEAGWTVTATDQNTGAGTGSMRKDGTGTALTNAFQIYNVDTTWDASTGSVALVTSTAVTGASGTAFTFNVKQLAISYDDVAGNYSITLVLTAALAV